MLIGIDVCSFSLLFLFRSAAEIQLCCWCNLASFPNLTLEVQPGLQFVAYNATCTTVRFALTNCQAPAQTVAKLCKIWSTKNW